MQEQHPKKQNYSFLQEQGRKYPTQPFRIQPIMQINSKSSQPKLSSLPSQQSTPQNKKKPTNSPRTQNQPKNLGHPKSILNQLLSSRKKVSFGNKSPSISKTGMVSQLRDEDSLKDYCQRQLTKVANSIIGRRKRKNKFCIKRLIQEVSTQRVADSNFQLDARELIRRMLLFDYSPNQNQKVECQQKSKDRALLLSEFKKIMNTVKGSPFRSESLQKAVESEKGYSSDFSSIFEENSSFSRSLFRSAIEEEDLQPVPQVIASSEPFVIEDQQEIKALLMSEGLLAFEKSQSNIQQIDLVEELEDDELHNESYQRFCKYIGDLDDQEELQRMSLLGDLGSRLEKDQEINQFN